MGLPDLKKLAAIEVEESSQTQDEKVELTAEEEQAYQEWEKGLDDNQRAEEIMEWNREHGLPEWNSEEYEAELLDDHIAMGSTLRDLRDYIESNGGNVVAITTLTAPEQDYRISISKENFENLSKYGEPLNELLREYGITDNIKGLTDREASEIIELLSDRGRNPETQ